MNWSESQLKQHTQKQSMKAIAEKSKVSGRKSTQTYHKVESVVKKQKPATIKIKPISESALQSQCVAWFKGEFPNIIIFAIPNAAKRSFRLAAKMKREGMVSGIPDLFIAKAKFIGSRETEEKIQVAGYLGLFIEMKRTPKNKTTDNQNHYLQKLQEAGYKTAVCHSFEEFQKVTKEYLQ
jgi:hypothetical protein